MPGDRNNYGAYENSTWFVVWFFYFIEHIENLDKKVHNQVSQFGSKVGTTLKMLKEKEPVINYRVEQSPARIDKLEEIINNLGSDFFL